MSARQTSLAASLEQFRGRCIPWDWIRRVAAEKLLARSDPANPPARSRVYSYRTVKKAYVERGALWATTNKNAKKDKD
jgi:hypothetical protein